MAVALEQNEFRDLLVPLIMNAGPTVVNGRLCVTLNAGDRDRGDCRPASHARADPRPPRQPEGEGRGGSSPQVE